MDVSELKKLLKNENIVLGSEMVLKLLRQNQIEQIYLAKNAPKTASEDIKRYASVNGVSAEVLDVPNDELGVLCKKPFSIAAIGLKKSSPSAGKKKH